MQTVPSLVGTGTAIAAAASGLVFGQSSHQDEPSTTRRRNHKREISLDRAFSTRSRSTVLPKIRPATSSAAQTLPTNTTETLSNTARIHQSSRPPLSRRQRPHSAHLTSSNSPSRGPSITLQGDSTGQFTGTGPRDSISSSGSWFKRLSIRPLSQHGSPRSSIAADSALLNSSYGSGVPILSRSGSSAQSMAPNKLVKRSSSKHDNLTDDTQRRSKGRLSSIRRPATSHQRSATLQHFRPDTDVVGLSSYPKYSFEEPISPEELLGASPIEEAQGDVHQGHWSSFFHSRTSGVSPKNRRYTNHGDASSQVKSTSSKRIVPDGSTVSPAGGAHLVKPRMVSASSATSGSLASTSHTEEEKAARVTGAGHDAGCPQRSEDLSARPRRSFSSSFSSASYWTSKTPGSLRRSKRGGSSHGTHGAQGTTHSKRHVSDPVRSLQGPVGRADRTTNAPILPIQQGSALSSAATSHRPAPKRNTSSPLPPPSSRPGLHVDLSKPSPAGGAAALSPRQNQPSGSSTSSAAMSQRRGSHYDRSSAMDSSDGDARDFVSGDEDDTDFKSDTMFDSLRTAGSGRVRTVETPLESVYDDSPPSTGGNKRSKRLSIQEMLDRTWDEDDKILEEDENALTPVRVAHRPILGQSRSDMPEAPRFDVAMSRNDLTQATRDFGRFSLDDDFDEDWTREVDDDAPFNALSPPSKGSSLNSQSINPNVRLALASIGGNGVQPANPPASHSERSLGNLFDWSEPSAQDKHDAAGQVSRPKTAYGKQETDPRGGRPSVRKGPMPTHVRSQSVPVVNEVANDDQKPTGHKYGTWGLGTKTVSEDWDEDFEFGGSTNEVEGKSSADLFAVPESIQASQPSVRAHSGQIRELSLLVNDLKRLCRHGRELNMLNGEQRPFWKEAEGIIALASPDEDNGNEDDQSGRSVYLDAFEAKDAHFDDDLDLPALDRLDAVMELKEPAMSKTAVVRERQSPRRRSVFSPDDDIFGSNKQPVPDERAFSSRLNRPRTPEGRPSKLHDVNGVVRSVIESVQQRATTEQAAQETQTLSNNANRMHFDTNSLRALVKRAGELRDILSDTIRRADQLTHSPARTPRHERRLDSSPAFTRVFDDPGSSPPRRPIKSRGNSTIVETSSPENSPPSSINRRVPLMTVS